uniref:Gag-pol polyprotein n=1 Tax=Cannabis sativa TaxID=3483 RepID=A0A803P3I8_CANSA
MEMFIEGGSTSRPPMLEGSNYPYWKIKMRAFLKVVDKRVWIAVVEGWSPPTFIDDDGVKHKRSSEWTTEEIERANFNFKALHALCNVVSTNQLKESRDIEALNFDELIGSLQNYELTLQRWDKGQKTKDSEKAKAR